MEGPGAQTERSYLAVAVAPSLGAALISAFGPPPALRISRVGATGARLEKTPHCVSDERLDLGT
jgi:hypothetical protein